MSWCSLIMEEKAIALGDRSALRSPALSSDYPMSLPLSHKLRWTEYTRRMRQFAIKAQGVTAPSTSATRARPAASGSAPT
jgi:hypothetical protein